MKLILVVIFIGFILITHFSIAKVKPGIDDDINLETNAEANLETKMEKTVIEKDANNNELFRTDSSYGQMLYENHCLGCHESQLYIRSNRQIKSLSELTAMVSVRANNQVLNWGEEEIIAVTLFLNQSYYHFSVSQRD